MINLLIKVVAHILKLMYGYEAINILLKNLPSRKINFILRLYGAKIGKNVIIKSPFIIHNADEKNKIFSNLKIGDNCFIGRDCIFDLKGKIIIHNNILEYNITIIMDFTGSIVDFTGTIIDF